jgi:hypothetical protein
MDGALDSRDKRVDRRLWIGVHWTKKHGPVRCQSGAVTFALHRLI